MKNEFRSSAVITAEIETVELRHAISRSARAVLDERRKDLLVNGSDAELDELELEAAKVRRDIDRAEAQLTALRAEFSDAEAAEGAARLDAAYARAQKAASIGVKFIEKDYAQHASAIVRILEQLAAIDDLINKANAELKEADDPRRIPKPNWTARAEPVTVIPARHQRERVEEPKIFVDGKEVEHTGFNHSKRFKEFDVPEQRIGGRTPPELPETVELPGVAYGQTLWSKFIPNRQELGKRFPEILTKAGLG